MLQDRYLSFVCFEFAITSKRFSHNIKVTDIEIDQLSFSRQVIWKI